MERLSSNTSEVPTVKFSAAVKGQIAALVILGGIGVGAIVTLEYLRPDKDNMPMALILVSFIASVLSYLKAEQSHLVMNNRMTEWLEKSDQAAELQGRMLAGEEQEARRVQDLTDTAAATRRIAENAATAAAEVLETAREKAEADRSS